MDLNQLQNIRMANSQYENDVNSRYKKELPEGYNDGSLSRFINAIKENGYGALENIDRFANEYAGATYSRADEFKAKKEALRDREKAWENYQDKEFNSNVAGALGDLTTYAPELAIGTSTAPYWATRALADGAKFGLTSYGLSNLYGKENPELDGALGATMSVFPMVGRLVKGKDKAVLKKEAEQELLNIVNNSKPTLSSAKSNTINSNGYSQYDKLSEMLNYKNRINKDAEMDIINEQINNNAPRTLADLLKLNNK